MTSWTTASSSTLATRLLFPGLRFNLITYFYPQTFDCQVIMNLAGENSEKGLQLVPGSQGMNVPSACTIVIIAGFRFI